MEFLFDLVILFYMHILIVEILQIGHVNKSGEVAGPRVLEHIVDVVLYMEVSTCTSLNYFYHLFLAMHFSHIIISFVRI